MKHRIEQICDVTVVTVTASKVTLGPGPEEEWIRESISRQIDTGKKRFVVDATRLQCVDPADMGDLVAIFKRVQASKGEVRFAFNSRQIELLQEIRLESVIPFDRDARSAIEAITGTN